MKEQGLFHTPDAPEAELHRHARARPRHRRAERSPARAGRRTASPLGASRSFRRLPSASSRACPRHAPRRSRGETAAAGRVAGGDGAAAPSPARPTTASRCDRRRALPLRPRLGGDRRDHQLHQHLEPVGDARGGPARQEGGRARPDEPAVGEDLLAPGSKVVTEYLDEAGLTPYLEQLGFHLVGYGCTTCIGNCGPLPEPISRRRSRQARPRRRSRCSPATATSRGASTPTCAPTTSPRRRWWSPTRSPAASTSTCTTRAARHRQRRQAGLPARHLADAAEVDEVLRSGAALGDVPRRVRRRLRRRRAVARACRCRRGTTYAWDPALDLRQAAALLRRHAAPSRRPVERHPRRARARAARRLHHHRPHLARRHHQAQRARPASTCVEHGVTPRDFNSYGARRGNHEVMVRGTFANVRLRNHLVPGIEGGVTRPPARRRADDASTTPRCATSARACR